MTELAVLLSLLVGFTRHGSLKALARLPLQHLDLAIAGFALQAVPFAARALGFPSGNWSDILLAVSYLPLLSFCAFNLHLVSGRWLFAGVLANGVVVAANGGQMPVIVWGSLPAEARGLQAAVIDADLRHQFAGSGVKLPWLGDWMYIPGVPTPIFSLGDLLLAIGIFLLIQEGMLAKFVDSPPSTPEG